MSKSDPDRAILGRLGAGCLVLAFIVEMVLLARAGHALIGVPILGALGAPFAFFAVCGLSRLSLEDRGARVVNVRRRSRLLLWTEIEHFSIGRHGLLRGVAVAELRDGRRVGIWAIQGPNAARRRSTAGVEQLIRAMNGELARRRPATAAELAKRAAGAVPAPQRSKRARLPAPPMGHPQTA